MIYESIRYFVDIEKDVKVSHFYMILHLKGNNNTTRTQLHIWALLIDEEVNRYIGNTWLLLHNLERQTDLWIREREKDQQDNIDVKYHNQESRPVLLLESPPLLVGHVFFFTKFYALMLSNVIFIKTFILPTL